MGGRLGGEEALPFTALWTPGATGRARRRLQTSVGVSCLLLPEAWKKELKDLASRVVVLTKENELKNKEVSAEQRSCLGRDEMDPSLCKEIPFRLVQPDQQKS